MNTETFIAARRDFWRRLGRQDDSRSKALRAMRRSIHKINQGLCSIHRAPAITAKADQASPLVNRF